MTDPKTILASRDRFGCVYECALRAYSRPPAPSRESLHYSFLIQLVVE
jgi:hypothetical protein